METVGDVKLFIAWISFVSIGWSFVAFLASRLLVLLLTRIAIA